MALNPLNSGNLEQLALKGLIRREDISSFVFYYPEMRLLMRSVASVCLSALFGLQLLKVLT